MIILLLLHVFCEGQMYLTFIPNVNQRENATFSKIVQNSFPVEKSSSKLIFLQKPENFVFQLCVLQNYDENFMQT